MSNHVESLMSLSHVWQVPQAGAVEEERQPAAQKVRRAGSTLALLSHERIALIDLSRRLPARECAVPESILAAGGNTGLTNFMRIVPDAAAEKTVVFWAPVVEESQQHSQALTTPPPPPLTFLPRELFLCQPSPSGRTLITHAAASMNVPALKSILEKSNSEVRGAARRGGAAAVLRRRARARCVGG